MKNFTQRILYGILIIIITSNLSVAQTVVKGVVRDAISKEPLQSVSVFVEEGRGVTTKEDGSFVYSTNAAIKTIRFSYVGFKTISKAVIPNQEQTIDVELVVTGALHNVTVKSKRGIKGYNKNVKAMAAQWPVPNNFF